MAAFAFEPFRRIASAAAILAVLAVAVLGSVAATPAVAGATAGEQPATLRVKSDPFPHAYIAVLASAPAADALDRIIVLSRLTIDPGAGIADMGWSLATGLLVVETGTVALALTRGDAIVGRDQMESDPEASAVLAAGQAALLAAGDWCAVAPDAALSLFNDGEETATVLVTAVVSRPTKL